MEENEYYKKEISLKNPSRKDLDNLEKKLL